MLIQLSVCAPLNILRLGISIYYSEHKMCGTFAKRNGIPGSNKYWYIPKRSSSLMRYIIVTVLIVSQTVTRYQHHLTNCVLWASHRVLLTAILLSEQQLRLPFTVTNYRQTCSLRHMGFQERIYEEIFFKIKEALYLKWRLKNRTALGHVNIVVTALRNRLLSHLVGIMPFFSVPLGTCCIGCVWKRCKLTKHRREIQ